MLIPRMPISFYITKYNLSVENYIEVLDAGVAWHGPYGYGTYMSRYEPCTFLDSYDDWVAEELFIIQDVNEFAEKRDKFQIAKEIAYEHAGRRPHNRGNKDFRHASPRGSALRESTIH